jgi:hypothetical protein
MSDYSRTLTVTTPVTLTAPEKVVSHSALSSWPKGSGQTYLFYHWVINGTAQGAGLREAGFSLMTHTTATAVYRRVRLLKLAGHTRVYEGTRSLYKATAYFTEGPSKIVTKLGSWRETASYLHFDLPGVLRAYSVSRDQTCYITSTYGGVTARYRVTVRNR